MRQKWEGDCGLWVLKEMILKDYAEILKIGLVGSLSSLQKSECLKLIILIFHAKNLNN